MFMKTVSVTQQNPAADIHVMYIYENVYDVCVYIENVCGGVCV